jgi:hypothetical protein
MSRAERAFVEAIRCWFDWSIDRFKSSESDAWYVDCEFMNGRCHAVSLRRLEDLHSISTYSWKADCLLALMRHQWPKEYTSHNIPNEEVQCSTYSWFKSSHLLDGEEETEQYESGYPYGCAEQIAVQLLEDHFCVGQAWRIRKNWNATETRRIGQFIRSCINQLHYFLAILHLRRWRHWAYHWHSYKSIRNSWFDIHVSGNLSTIAWW